VGGSVRGGLNYNLFMKKFNALVFLFSLPALAQLPPEWIRREALGAELAKGSAWWGAGLWSADASGPPAPLVDSLGLGNSLKGSGFHLEGGLRAGRWDFAGEALGVRDPEGSPYLTLYRSHAWWRGAKGWQAGFEQEPLVWGYGLNGGYLLGEASRPFPRLRLESPYRALSLFKAGLGEWGFQTFLGRLENHRELSASMQDLSYRRHLVAQQGEPQAPLLAGYRLQARFGSRVTLYLNYLNLWAGTLDGKGVTSGYNLGEYATALFGLKDTLAEASYDPATQSSQGAGYKNKARSASSADWGIRVESPRLARLFRAEKAWFSLSRGSKSMGWPVGVFIKNPPKYLLKDVSADLRNLFTGRFGFGWKYDARYAVPSLLTPNDDVGILVSWPGVRLGLEYLDTSNPVEQGHRTFAHPFYISGFYYHGDPLGNALGGETRATTARLELDASPRLTLVSWLNWGIRPFRDDPALWQAAHPGASPAGDRLFGLQQAARWRLTPAATLNLGAAWERHGAVEYEAGRRGNGLRWFTDLAYRWGGDSKQ